MKKILVRAGLAVLGMVVVLTWWTYHDTGSNVHSTSSIPTKVGVGGNQLEVFTDASTTSTMRISFSDLRKPVGSQQILDSWERTPAGTRTWTIDVPNGIGGYIELEADHPNTGDALSVRIKMNGREVDTQTEKLERPLEPNTAFFVQFQYDDYSKAFDEAHATGDASESGDAKAE
jgi:hypothetical protein